MDDGLIIRTEIPLQRKHLKTALLTLLALLLVACSDSEEPTPTPIVAVPTIAATQTVAPTPTQSYDEIAARDGKYSALPPMTLDAQKYYFATFKTVKGDIKVQLYADKTPITVNNFVFLARDGFYDNTTFHRVLENFMAQGGDPTGRGNGGPGYKFADELGEGLVFDRPGLLAMANGGPNTNGSQFFFTFAPTPHLNGRHTIFGEVVEGIEVLDTLKRRDPQEGSNFPGDALTTVVIEESTTSTLPTPTPPPPTPTAFSPSGLDASIRPLATLTTTQRSNYFNAPPITQVIVSQVYTALMITSQGPLTIELRGDLAPIAVNNFVVLADLGFYDNTPVNLISPGNFIIVGAPISDPNSDAGYSIEPELSLPIKPDVGFIAYVPKTNDPSRASSSQLFIMLGDPGPDAPSQYSFFGRVSDGIEILPSLATTDTIQSVTIIR